MSKKILTILLLGLIFSSLHLTVCAVSDGAEEPEEIIKEESDIKLLPESMATRDESTYTSVLYLFGFELFTNEELQRNQNILEMNEAKEEGFSSSLFSTDALFTSETLSEQELLEFSLDNNLFITTNEQIYMKTENIPFANYTGFYILFFIVTIILCFYLSLKWHKRKLNKKQK